VSHFLKIGADGASLAHDATDNVAVVDTRTNLMWSAADVSDKQLDFADAGKACAELSLAGFSDWRLPTVEELFLLADRSKFNPAIDTDAFPATKVDWYWSSTVDAESPSVFAWIVLFHYGLSYLYLQHGRARVRAVRSVSPSASGQ
jgi:hypothetical protein